MCRGRKFNFCQINEGRGRLSMVQEIFPQNTVVAKYHKKSRSVTINQNIRTKIAKESLSRLSNPPSPTYGLLPLVFSSHSCRRFCACFSPSLSCLVHLAIKLVLVPPCCPALGGEEVKCLWTLRNKEEHKTDEDGNSTTSENTRVVYRYATISNF